jgi:transcriptional regulator with XRE-family HTH domain
MPLRTTAVEAAAARGWSKAELKRRTGLSLSLIYNLEHGSRPGAKAIAAIMAAFPDLPFERLFVTSSTPPDSRKLITASGSQEVAA